MTIEIGLDYSEVAHYTNKYPELKFTMWEGNMVRVSGSRENLQRFLANDYTVDGSEIDYIFEFQTV
jgi:hypothetical protein